MARSPTGAGLGVSGGRGVGRLQIDVDAALDHLDAGRAVVLAMVTSTPADVVAMVRAAGVITVEGTAQSHVAIVSRAAGVPAVVAVRGLTVGSGGVLIDGTRVPVGTPVEVDGDRGVVRAMVDAAPAVIGIQLAKASRLGMVAVPTAEIETAAGLVGDRYHGSRHRQLSVQSQAELSEAEAAFGSPIDPLLTRRNITLDVGRLPRDPGHRFSLGAVELEVVREAAPCSMLDEGLGAGARASLRRRAGVICRVIRGARLTIGDPADLRTADDST